MGSLDFGDLAKEAVAHVWPHGRLLNLRDLRDLSEDRNWSTLLRVFLLSRHPQERIRWTQALALTLLLVLHQGRDVQVLDRVGEVIGLLIGVRKGQDLRVMGLRHIVVSEKPRGSVAVMQTLHRPEAHRR